ncbi:relaxase domain-containing protein [Streptomyces sp. NPDC052236]|uniref:relaxase domain-containing protein n=1 Tax=Streptomyces sp. NPDC052236 TaxID=3365686 RepID=UPI0037D2C5E5
MEEVSARLGWVWEPREVTPGRRPVMEIAGIDQGLVGRQSTRRQQIADAMPVLVADYEEVQGHEPGERAAYALDRQAADGSRPPKLSEARSLSKLYATWRDSAIGKVGACTVYRLAERAGAAVAAARVRPVVGVALAAVDTVAVVYVMRGGFRHRHLLTEARRHLTYVLRGQRHEPGLDEQILRAAIDGYTRSIGRRLTADLRSLYPRDTDGQAVVRPLTRNRSASRYERARLAAGALTARVHAERRSRRLGSRALPHTVAMPAGAPPRPRPERGEVRKVGRGQEQATDVAAVEQTRLVIEAAAKLRDGIRERAVAHVPRPLRQRPPRPAPSSPPSRPRRAGTHPLEESHDHVARRDPRIQAAAALVKDGARERASAYGPPSWEPIWKRPRKPKSQRGAALRTRAAAGRMKRCDMKTPVSGRLLSGFESWPVAA